MSADPKRAIAAVFPGQGSQKPGMGRSLLENWAKAAGIMEKADEILGRPVSKICLDGPKETLDSTENSQPAVFLINSIYWDWLIENSGFSFEYVAGHSLGEYSALYAAKSADFETLLKLVDKRAKLMQREAVRKPGRMAAVLGLDISVIEKSIAGIEDVAIANFNCPGQAVISGSVEGIAEAEEALGKSGAAKVVSLAVGGAFHSSMMEAAAKEFKMIVEDSDLHDPKIPVIGNVTAEPLVTKEEIKSELSKQMTNPVLWEKSIDYMVERGVGSFVEVGPGRVLKGLIGRINEDVKVISVDAFDFRGDFADFENLVGSEH